VISANLMTPICDLFLFIQKLASSDGLCPKCRSENHEETLAQPVGDSNAANWI